MNPSSQREATPAPRMPILPFKDPPSFSSRPSTPLPPLPPSSIYLPGLLQDIVIATWLHTPWLLVMDSECRSKYPSVVRLLQAVYSNPTTRSLLPGVRKERTRRGAERGKEGRRTCAEGWSRERRGEEGDEVHRHHTHTHTNTHTHTHTHEARPELTSPHACTRPTSPTRMTPSFPAPSATSPPPPAAMHGRTDPTRGLPWK
jgi:hypothetical protein